MKSFSIAWAVCGLASIVAAQTVQKCPQAGLCYTVNVPAVSASSGRGDLYIQITAPSSMQWVGLGQGGQMAGSNMFLIYAGSDGQNVTLSPRLGVGLQEPDYNTAAQVSLLEGSGIVNNVMTANIRCSSCFSWSGGSMSFTDTASSWIWSYKSGASLASNSASLNNLQIHDANDNFNLDLTKAAGGNSLNPFVNSVSNSGGTATGSTTTSAMSTSTSSAASSAASSSTSGSSGSDDSAAQVMNMRIMAHGIIMALAFLIFFPFGALSIRFLSHRSTVWIHATAQLTAYALAISGVSIGIWLATTEQEINSPHPIIGLTVFSGLFLQPFLGLVHHFIYRRTKRSTLWAIAHVWWGRALILLGVINGGLGLQLSGNTVSGEIAYGVIAGVFFVAYIAIVLDSWRRNRGTQRGERGEKISMNDMQDNRQRGGRSRSNSGSRSRGYHGSAKGPDGQRMRTFI